MSRRKKNLEPISEAQDVSDSLELSEPVETEIEDQEEPKEGFNFGDLMSRAQENLEGAVSEETPRGRKRKRGKYVPQKKREDVSTLFVSILTLALASWSVPNDLKPDDDEVNALSGYSSRLLLRHIDLSGRMTADVLDSIGILAVLSGWYARTAPAWREYNQNHPTNRNPKQTPIEPVGQETTEAKVHHNYSDPIRNISPQTANFLDKPRTGENHD